MKECIELEHSDEYQRGYADGIESFRAIFNEFTAHKTCETCKYWYQKSCSNNDGIAYLSVNAVYEDDYCKDYELKVQE